MASMILLAPGVLAGDRIEEVASRGVTMDGAYESASAIQPGLLFVPNTPVRITIVQDATNLIFSLRGSAKGRPTETVEVYFDGKRPTMPTAPFFTGLKSLDGKTMEYIKNAFDILP